MFHFDYCFASQNLLKAFKLEIPPIEDWIEYSDHAPLVVDINLAQIIEQINDNPQFSGDKTYAI